MAFVVFFAGRNKVMTRRKSDTNSLQNQRSTKEIGRFYAADVKTSKTLKPSGIKTRRI